MTKSRVMQGFVCGLAALAVLTLTTQEASAGMTVQAASGHPHNGTSMSKFAIVDGKVSFNIGCSVTWDLPIPVPYSTSSVNYTVGGIDTSVLISEDVCTFSSSGTWIGCWSLNNGPVSVSVPANGGTVFVRAYNSGCISGNNYFSGAYISN